MVSERTQKRHCKLDAEGKFCSAKFVVDRHASNCIDDRRQAIGTGVQVSRQTQWRDRRSQLYRALMGAQADPDYGAHGFPDYMDFDDIGRLPPMQYGIHMMPRTKLPLDEAIYRETWKLQSMLDEAKMPQELQDRILKMLYGGKKNLHSEMASLIRTSVAADWATSSDTLGHRGKEGDMALKHFLHSRVCVARLINTACQRHNGGGCVLDVRTSGMLLRYYVLPTRTTTMCPPG